MYKVPKIFHHVKVERELKIILRKANKSGLWNRNAYKNRRTRVILVQGCCYVGLHDVRWTMNVIRSYYNNSVVIAVVSLTVADNNMIVRLVLDPGNRYNRWRSFTFTALRRCVAKLMTKNKLCNWRISF